MEFTCQSGHIDGSEYGLARHALAHSHLKFYVGILRVVSFLSLLCIDRKNRRQLQQSSSIGARFAVVLPVYHDVLNAFILWSIIFGIVDITNQSNRSVHYSVAADLSIFHFLVESLSFYLIQPGAGKNDFRRGLMCGLGSMLLSGITFVLSETLYQSYQKAPVIVFSIFNSVLILYYAILLVTPLKIIFKRPALVPFSSFMLLYNLVWLIMNYLTYRHASGSICAVYAVYAVLDGILVPIVLYYTLSLDSQVSRGISMHVRCKFFSFVISFANI